MANDWCRTCGQKGHRTEYCKNSENACRHCDKTDHHEMDKAKCKRQYCAPDWYFDIDNPKMSRKIKNFNRFDSSTYYLIAELKELSKSYGSCIESDEDTEVYRNPDVANSLKTTSHADDFIVKKAKKTSKKSKSVVINESQNSVKTFNKFAALQTPEKDPDDADDEMDQSVIEIFSQDLDQPMKSKQSLNVNNRQLNPSKKSKKSNNVDKKSDEDLDISHILHEVDQNILNSSTETIKDNSDATTQPPADSNNELTVDSVQRLNDDYNKTTGLIVQQTNNTNVNTSLPVQSTNSASIFDEPETSGLPNSQQIFNDKPPDLGDPPEQAQMQGLGEKDNSTILPNCQPPKVSVDDVMYGDSDVTITACSSLIENSKDLSHDTWCITYKKENNCTDEQMARLNVIIKSFELNQIGKNKKFDFYKNFMKRHNVNCIVTPENYSDIYRQVQKICDLPDYRSRPAKLRMVQAALNSIEKLGFIDDQNNKLPGFSEKPKMQLSRSNGDFSSRNTKMVSRQRSLSGDALILKPNNNKVKNTVVTPLPNLDLAKAKLLPNIDPAKVKLSKSSKSTANLHVDNDCVNEKK